MSENGSSVGGAADGGGAVNQLRNLQMHGSNKPPRLKEHLSCIKLNWNSTLESEKFGISLSVLRRDMPRTKHCRHRSTIKIDSLVLHSCEVRADVKTMMQEKCARRPRQQK